MHTVTPDKISFSTFHIYLGLKSTSNYFSSATAFAYKRHNGIYLITNWHNLTGKNHLTKKHLSETLAMPDVLATPFHHKTKLNQRVMQFIDLYENDDFTRPLWLEHPTYRNRVDIVAIKIPQIILDDSFVFPINDYDFNPEIDPVVGDDTFVIGYPFRDLTIGGLPIWKKASIASEPELDYEDMPKLLIDTATRRGLSGSPVIMQRTGLHGMDNGKVVGSTLIGTIRTFIGIYSGRIGDDEIKAQLGIVWKKHLIDEIIDGNLIANHIS